MTDKGHQFDPDDFETVYFQTFEAILVYFCYYKIMIDVINPVAYYDEWADVFAKQASNEKANRFEYEKNMPSLLAMSESITGDVLDFGCGAGNFSVMFQRQDRVVDGCDPSNNLLGIARESHQAINFISCNSDGEVETDKTYDLIIAKLVFHYVVDLDIILSNLSSKIKEGGHLLFSVPHPDKTQRHFNSNIKEGMYVDEVGNFGLTLTMVHRTLDRLGTLFADSNLDIVEIVTVYDNEKPKRLNVLTRKL